MNIRCFAVFRLLAFIVATGANAAVIPASSDQVANATRDATAQSQSDFVITFSSSDAERSKFLTLGWNGFAGNLIRWRYNDANRTATAGVPIVASAAETVTRMQTAMAKWTAACNINFVYDGTTTLPASLATGNSDSFNVIAWGAIAGSTTGVAYSAAGGPPGGPFTLTESDIVINKDFNPNVDVTMLHEVGHMIGLDHSNVANTVMSGPPLTPYVSLNVLTADDIAGCQNLYGPPVATARTISGAITNGAGVSGVTFCAQPAAGVTCTASDGAGTYSCTVPNGWTGTLHSPSVANNRIPAQSFTSVSTNITRNVTALSGIPGCNLDVDNNGLFEPATDGVAILRRMLGYPSAAFSGLAGACAANTSAAAIYNATTSNYNVTGGAQVRATADGLAIIRAMNGKTGTDVTNGLSGANSSWTTIQNALNNLCGGSF